jgi:nucleotide-binding universal stress UspA family protein
VKTRRRPVDDKTIVVGTDGSPGAEAALDWAVEEARQTGRRVLVVHAARVGESAVLAPLTLVGVPDPTSHGNEVLKRAAEHCRRAGLVVETMLAGGPPADRLVETSDGAAMLVIGARGLGQAAALLLGSVSHDCAQRARCPLVVVKPAHAAHPEKIRGGERHEAAHP